MGKTNQPAWAKRILELLAQAKAKDPDFETFGADSHQYKLAPPVSEKKVQKFERQYHIQLPEEYRNFLMLIGNGGAGPYFGIYGLKMLKEELDDSYLYCVQSVPVIYPKMSDKDWDKIVDSEDRCEEDEGPVYAGLLPIGNQGCTFMTGLILMGPYRGQVVYYSVDFCNKPFFVREKGFLAWYERWLREVIAGYDEGPAGFGVNVDGNPGQLMELYKQTEDPKEKIEIIASFYKFKTLPGKQRTYFKQICTRESDMEVRTRLIKMMVHFHVPEMADEIERLWEEGACEEAIFIINYEGTWQIKEKWCERIFEKLLELHGDAFRYACYIFMEMKDYPDVHAGRLKEALLWEKLDRNDREELFYCIRNLRGKEEVLDYFLDYLATEEDPLLLSYGIQAMEGVEDRRLQELYVKLLEKYRTCEDLESDYGAVGPDEMVVTNLLIPFDLFGLDYQGACELLKDDERWKEWKQQNGFGGI